MSNGFASNNCAKMRGDPPGRHLPLPRAAFTELCEVSGGTWRQGIKGRLQLSALLARARMPCE
jgi:hypothetical protein